MSRGIVEAASRSLVFHVRPSGLTSLLAELGRLRCGGYTKKTYLVRERALLLELTTPAMQSKVLAQLATVPAATQAFVNYPVFSRDVWSPSGDDSSEDGARAALQLRRKLQLDIVPDFNWPAFRGELLQAKSMSAQMLAYYNRRLLGKPHVALRSVLANGIQALLQSLSAGTALKIVGSIRTGTSFDRSDCDMNLWFYDNCCAHLCRSDFAPDACAAPERLRHCLEAFSELRIVPLRNHHPAGFSSPSFPNRVFLSHLGLLLKDIDSGVTDLQCHTGAAVPVVRARHSFLGFHFDVSLNTRFNHKLNFLISALSAACPPFTPLLIVVKGLLKESRLRLIESDDYSGQLTTFKVTALLVYFLQGCGYAPPLSRLLGQVRDGSKQSFSSLSAAETQRMRDAFARNARNLEALLKQFLRFLIEYPFADSGIDLLNFAEVPRADLPQELRSHFIVVLNPTSDRPTNVTRNISAADWQRYCAVFSQMLDHLESQALPTSPASSADSWGLVGLFDFPESSLGDPDCDLLQRSVVNARLATG